MALLTWPNDTINTFTGARPDLRRYQRVPGDREPPGCESPEALAFRDETLEAGELLVTSDYVLDESYTIIRLRAGHPIAVEFGEAVRGSRALHIESVTPEILNRAWMIFKTFSTRHSASPTAPASL